MGNLLPSLGRRKLPMLEMPKVGGGKTDIPLGATIWAAANPDPARYAREDGSVINIAAPSNFPFQTKPGSGWQRKTSGVTVNLHGIAFGNGTYVAVGDTGTILTSTDFETWTPQAVPAQIGTNYPMLSLIFTAGRFRLPCYRLTGSIYYIDFYSSADGKAWTLDSSYTNGDSAVPLYNPYIHYLNGIYFCVVSASYNGGNQSGDILLSSGSYSGGWARVYDPGYGGYILRQSAYLPTSGRYVFFVRGSRVGYIYSTSGSADWGNVSPAAMGAPNSAEGYSPAWAIELGGVAYFGGAAALYKTTTLADYSYNYKGTGPFWEGVAFDSGLGLLMYGSGYIGKGANPYDAPSQYTQSNQGSIRPPKSGGGRFFAVGDTGRIQDVVDYAALFTLPTVNATVTANDGTTLRSYMRIAA